MRHRPSRLQHITGIGWIGWGRLPTLPVSTFLRLENLDVDIPPDEGRNRPHAARGRCLRLRVPRTYH
jgi:hypothetical protein